MTAAPTTTPLSCICKSAWMALSASGLQEPLGDLELHRTHQTTPSLSLSHTKREEAKGRFCKRAVLANVPSFRLFVPSFRFFVTSFQFWGSTNTGFCTLVMVFVPSFRFVGSRNIRQKPPFWKPPNRAQGINCIHPPD